MLDTLLDMEIAMTIIKGGDAAEEEEDVIDVHHRKLQTDFEVLDHETEEFKLVEKYAQTTHAPTHTAYKLKIEEVFKATGYMFGKGIYFADMITKSANYCFTNPSKPTGLLLLSDVALGEMYLRRAAEYVEKLPSGKLSTKGCGGTGPKEFIDNPLLPDIKVPMGPPTRQEIPSEATPQRRGKNDTDLLYNEYIVYDVNQVNVRYLVRARFEYGRYY
ncbi:hypothetical protein HK102_000808 [Quaeritorhiza haematococci]|nr:hypothetical protein HK102_000808 [Quaeritorhiza haematococci]